MSQHTKTLRGVAVALTLIVAGLFSSLGAAAVASGPAKPPAGVQVAGR